MDVSKFCRGCMEEVASWESEDLDEKTMEMFSFCTNIEVSDEDTMPKHFCYKCSVLVESFYEYIKKARRVNNKLKKLVQSKSHSFVEQFLSQTSLQAEEKNDIEINNCLKSEEIMVNEVKCEVNDDQDDFLFDDDDDRCLSEFKTEKLENEIKCELVDNTEDLTVSEECLRVPKPKLVKRKFKNNKCSICKKVFNSKGWYSRHMKTAHRKVKEAEINIDEEKLSDVTKEIGEGECNDETKEIGEGECNDETKEIKETGDSNNEIKCRVCDKVFVSKASRTKHLNEVHSQSVDGKKVYLCPYCPKTFPKYCHMYYHTTSHPDQTKHPCPTCGKEYRIRKELQQHMRTHLKERPFACDKCDMRACSLLQQHMRTHLKERPFACDKCDMRFKIKGVLITHLKWHEGIRPHLCSICGRSFVQSGNLESHMRVHTGEKPFSCSQCPFRSTSHVSLKRHLLRHSGERPFPCSYCPKRFYESCSLTRHVRCHTRERPYRCPYCSRVFNDSGKRRRHFLMTHKMAPEEIPPMDKDGCPVERTERNCARKRWVEQ